MSPWIALRSLILWSAVIPLTMFASTLAILVSWLPSGPAHVHRIARVWAATLLRLAGVRLRVENRERIHKGTAIILCNHQSMIDIGAAYVGLDTQFCWLAKESLFRIPFFGTALARAGFISVPNSDVSGGREALYSAARRIQKGRTVMIYPEGSRTTDGKLQPFKAGAFVLAKKAKVVLQPVTIVGAYDLLPVQSGFFQKMVPGEIRLVIHNPVFPEDYEAMNTRQLSGHIRDVIRKPLPEEGD